MLKVIASANLTKDVDLKHTQDGKIAIAEFSIASNEYYKGEQKATFVNCVAYGSTADFIAKFFKKGDGIVIDGKLNINFFEGKDGQKRYYTEIVVERVEFATGRSSEGKVTSETKAENKGNLVDSKSTPKYSRGEADESPVSDAQWEANFPIPTDDDVPF